MIKEFEEAKLHKILRRQVAAVLQLSGFMDEARAVLYGHVRVDEVTDLLTDRAAAVTLGQAKTLHELAAVTRGLGF